MLDICDLSLWEKNEKIMFSSPPLTNYLFAQTDSYKYLKIFIKPWKYLSALIFVCTSLLS